MLDLVGNPEDQFSHNEAHMIPRGNLTLGFPTRSNKNLAVQPQKMARGLLEISDLESIEIVLSM